MYQQVCYTLISTSLEQPGWQLVTNLWQQSRSSLLKQLFNGPHNVAVTLCWSFKTFVKHVQQRSVSLANGLLYALLVVSIKRCLYDQVFFGRSFSFIWQIIVFFSEIPEKSPSLEKNICIVWTNKQLLHMFITIINITTVSYYYYYLLTITTVIWTWTRPFTHI